MKKAAGFTLIELMIVIAIIGIMATYALPSFQDRVIRAQVSEGLGLAEFARQSVQAYYAKNRRMPKDNAAAGLPPADKIIGNYVAGVAVNDGAIVITYGNRSNRNIVGRKLAVRPATVEGYPSVPLAWVCGRAPGPDKMRLLGPNETDIPAELLPIDCR